MTLSLTALPLRVQAVVTNPVLLNEHKGSALRGALFEALRRRSCARLALATCHPCELVPVCPISALVATVDPEWDRGADPPRPLTVDPPLDQRTRYEEGDLLEFGVTVFGSAARLLPYLVLAVADAGKAGLGRRYRRAGFWTRGRFEVRAMDLVNPFSGAREPLYTPEAGSDRIVRAPGAGITHAEVLEAQAAAGAGERVTLDFLTPTRLVRKGELLRQFDLLAFLQRLRERLEALERRYGRPQETVPSLFDGPAAAERLRVAGDNTRWQEVRGFSRRQRQALPLGGFTGAVTLEGDLRPLLPFLAWGQLTHVGKDATKGNGWYVLQPA